MILARDRVLLDCIHQAKWQQTENSSTLRVTAALAGRSVILNTYSLSVKVDLSGALITVVTMEVGTVSAYHIQHALCVMDSNHHSVRHPPHGTAKTTATYNTCQHLLL